MKKYVKRRKKVSNFERIKKDLLSNYAGDIGNENAASISEVISNSKVARIWSHLTSTTKKRIIAFVLAALTITTTTGAIKREIEKNEAIDPNSISDVLDAYISDNYQEYVVKSGDSLSTIAQKYGLNSYKDLLEIEGNEKLKENPDNIQPGQIIYVPQLELVNDNKETKSQQEVRTDKRESWDKLMKRDGYVKGVDISFWNNDIDLASVLDKNKDLNFVIIRAAYFLGKDPSNFEVDENFANWAEICHEKNIPFGLYFWPSFKNIETADKEVDFILDQVHALESKGIYLEMPICLDVELQADSGGNIVSRIMEGDQESRDAFRYTIEKIENAGYYCNLYTGNNALAYDQYKSFVESLNVDMWVPRYPSNSSIPIENEVGNIGSVNYDNPSIRQYSDKGVLNGYSQNVDLNVCYVNYPELMRKYGLNHLDEKNKTESRLY